MAVSIQTRPTVPPAPARITVLPAPRTEPMPDDELAALGLDAPPLTAPPLPLDLPTGARVRRGGQPGAGRPTVAFELAGVDLPEVPRPPLPPAVRRFVASCVEIIGGFRPVAHLRPFCAPLARDAVAERLMGRPAMQRRPATRKRATSAPPRTGRVHQPAPVDRVAVRRVHLCEVSDEVVELAAVLCRRDTVWALAARLELIDGRWLCTHLELV